MTLTSGPRQERIVRNGIFMLMCIGMGGWFAYDGYVGYPKLNVNKFLEKFPAEVRAAPDAIHVYAGANLEHADAIQDRLKSAAASQRREELASAIGGPPSIETDDALYYFGQDCLLTIKKHADRVSNSIEAIPGEKTSTDFRFQKRMGIAVGVVGLYMLVFLVRVIRVRAEVSDDGLSLNGRSPIPFAKMKSLDTADFAKKGRVHIECDDDKNPRVLLDEYHYAKFPEIMAGICEKAGFEDPVAAEQAEKAKRATAASDTEPDK